MLNEFRRVLFRSKKCGAIKGSAFFQLRNMIFITIFINTYENLGLSEYLFFQPDTRRRCG